MIWEEFEENEVPILYCHLTLITDYETNLRWVLKDVFEKGVEIGIKKAYELALDKAYKDIGEAIRGLKNETT